MTHIAKVILVMITLITKIRATVTMTVKKRTVIIKTTQPLK